MRAARWLHIAIVACLVSRASVAAQSPWIVSLTPTMNPLPAGFCAAIHLTVRDTAVKDAPRNPLGQRVTLADFDVAVTTPDGRSAVARQIDASHWSACACQGSLIGAVATITATYPSQSLAAAARVPGVTFSQTATFAVAAPKGPDNPAPCPLVSTMVATSAPGLSNTAGRSPSPPQSAPAAGPLSTVAPPATPPPAAAASGNYLVTLTGVRAFQVSHDGVLAPDGPGDEIYAAAYVRRYHRVTKQVAEQVSKKSTVYVGIQDGDPLPAGPLLAARSAPPHATSFPWKLWQGTLTDDDDVLVITPSIWEMDGNAAFYTQWAQRQASLTPGLINSAHVQTQIAKQDLASLLLLMSKKTQNDVVAVAGRMSSASGAGVEVSNTPDDVLFTTFPMVIGNILAPGGDRPIGIIPNGTSGTMLPDHSVVLTREIIEKALARQPRGLIPSTVPGGAGLSGVGSIATKPGILVVDLVDGEMPGFLGFPQRPAKYQLFIQVERMP